MAVSDPLGFPPELYSKPSALVGLCGLDIQNNSLHRSIWDVFRTSHERSSITCKLFGLSHSFPPVKAKVLIHDLTGNWTIISFGNHVLSTVSENNL